MSVVVLVAAERHAAMTTDLFGKDCARLVRLLVEEVVVDTKAEE